MSKLLEPSKLSVAFNGGASIGGVRLLRCIEVSQEDSFVSDGDGAAKLSVLRHVINAFVARLVCALFGLIAAVFFLRCLSQIDPSVIVWIAVMVVDIGIRPRSRHDDVGESVSVVTLSVNPDHKIFGEFPRQSARESPPASPNSPTEIPSLRIIRKDRANVGRFKIVDGFRGPWFLRLSHGALRALWSGPGEGVSSAFPVPHYAICGMIGQR